MQMTIAWRGRKENTRGSQGPFFWGGVLSFSSIFILGNCRQPWLRETTQHMILERDSERGPCISAAGFFMWRVTVKDALSLDWVLGRQAPFKLQKPMTFENNNKIFRWILFVEMSRMLYLWDPFLIYVFWPLDQTLHWWLNSWCDIICILHRGPLKAFSFLFYNKQGPLTRWVYFIDITLKFGDLFRNVKKRFLQLGFLRFIWN